VLPTLLLILGSLIGAQAEPACMRAADCKQQALDAAAREDFESFHSLAWRAIQAGPPNDPDLMFMLARAQALSARPDDALVMLGRLADRGVLHPEVETLDDFKHVRDMAGWPALRERLNGVTPMPVAPAAVAAPVAERPKATPAAPKAEPPVRPKADPHPVVPPAPTPDSPAPPVDPPAPPISKPVEFSPTEVPIAGLALIPPAIRAPMAIAYDKVSARMIIADDSSGTLRVISDLSGGVVDLVSAGWGGGYHSNALVIDSKRGDLWVVGTRTGSGPESIVHHVQLISGRTLYSVTPPEDAGATRFAAVALSSSSVFVLDAEGGRIYELAGSARTLRQRIAVPQKDLMGLALASDTVAYVTHASGIARIDLATKRIENVKASPGISLDGIEWISYFDNSLLAVQRRPDGTMAAMRFRIGRGGTITGVDTFGAAAGKGAAVLGDTFYFVAAIPGGSAVARVNLR